MQKLQNCLQILSRNNQNRQLDVNWYLKWSLPPSKWFYLLPNEYTDGQQKKKQKNKLKTLHEKCVWMLKVAVCGQMAPKQQLVSAELPKLKDKQ